jgi:hypothetical protein
MTEWKRFIRVFTDITKEMATYQITCFENMKNNSIHQLDITYQLMQKVRETKALNNTIDQKVNTLV